MDELIKEELNDERAKRPIPIGRVFLAFIIATIIFLAGFILSYTIAYEKYQSLAISQEQMKYNILSLELEKELLGSTCQNIYTYSFTQELDNTGADIAILEEKLGKNNQQVLNQKKIYTILEIQHFLMIKDYNSKCKQSIPTILFFYSNENNIIDKTEKIGYILDSFKKTNPDVMTYSFDYNLDSRLIKELKIKYNITQPNTILVKEKIKITDLTNISQLEKAFKG